ncbi:hypothetical protein J6590_101593, partial [Homalodisca vitripennis]
DWRSKTIVFIWYQERRPALPSNEYAAWSGYHIKPTDDLVTSSRSCAIGLEQQDNCMYM